MILRCEDVVRLLGPLLDSALEADDRASVEDHLSGCASCRERKALIAAQGQALRETIVARAAGASFDGFSDRVLARVRSEKTSHAAERLRVWSSEMWGAHRGAFAATAGVALAACMALAVLFLPQQKIDQPPLLADASLPSSSSSSQVEVVDFGTHDGAVLQLTGDTTVIWMSDDRAVPQ